MLSYGNNNSLSIKLNSIIICIIMMSCIIFLGVRSMSETTFRETWKSLVPYILTAKPMTDLCAMCQLNNTLIYRSATATTDAKKARLEQQLVLIVCNVLLLHYSEEIVCIK